MRPKYEVEYFSKIDFLKKNLPNFKLEKKIFFNFFQFWSHFFEKVFYVIDVLGHKFGPIACVIAFEVSKDIFWIQCTHSGQNFDVPATSGRSNISSILSIF